MIKPLLITLFICVTLVHAAKKTPPGKQTTTRSKNSSTGKDELSDDDEQDSDQDESSDAEDDDADDEGSDVDKDADEDEDSSSKSKPKSSKSKDTDSKSKNKNSKGTNSVSSKSKNKIDSTHPSLTCIIFSDVGCHIECIMIGTMYNVKTEGSCNIHNTCDCTSSQDTSLDTLWKRKFNSDAILRQIKKKPSLAKRVREKLKQPFRTEKQSKQDLKSILSSDQFKKLRPLDTSLASQLTNSNGKLDYGKIESYVLGVLRWVMPLPNNSLRGLKFQNKLMDALKKIKNTNTLQHIISEVRQSKNKDLVNIVDEYVRKNKKFKEKPVSKKIKDAAETLEDFIGFTIIDEFIYFIKYHTWLDRVTSIPFEPPRSMTWLPPPPPLPVVYMPPVYVPPPPPVYVPPPPPVYIPPMPPMPSMPPMPPMPPMPSQGYYY